MADPLPITESLEIPGTDLDLTFSRSGGPGGQHANTADTRAQLRFALGACEVLDEGVKQRLRDANPTWVVGDGDLLLASDAHRSQHRNVQEVRDRLAEAIRAALVPPRRRRRTRPTRASKERRLKAKKGRGFVKRLRGRVRRDE